MAEATATAGETGGTSNIQVTVAILFGAVLALVGILGPVLGGANNDLIIFGRNYLHDAIHLLSGLAGLAAGYYAGGTFASDYNKALGVVYALVTVLGFLLFDLFADLIALNTADNFLHLALAVAFLAVGFALGE